MVYQKAARWSSGLRLRPLTPATGVRIPHGSPIVGVNNDEDPPVPIPNTEVKLIRVDNTWREAAREDRSAPTQRKERRLCLLSFFAYTNHSNMGEDFKRLERRESPDVLK